MKYFIYLLVYLFTSLIPSISCDVSVDLHLDKIDISNFKIKKIKNYPDGFVITPNRLINDVFISEKPIWRKSGNSECTSVSLFNATNSGPIVFLSIKESLSNYVFSYQLSEEAIINTGLIFSSVILNKFRPKFPESKIHTSTQVPPGPPGVPVDFPTTSNGTDSVKGDSPQEVPISPPKTEDISTQTENGNVDVGIQIVGGSANSEAGLSPTESQTNDSVVVPSTLPIRPKSGCVPPAECKKTTDSSPITDSPETKPDSRPVDEHTCTVSMENNLFDLDISDDFDSLFVNFQERQQDNIILKTYESVHDRLITSVRDGTTQVAKASKDHFRHVECYLVDNIPVLLFLNDGDEQLYYQKEKEWLQIEHKTYGEVFTRMKLDKVKNARPTLAILEPYNIELNAVFKSTLNMCSSSSLYNNYIYRFCPTIICGSHDDVPISSGSTTPCSTKDGSSQGSTNTSGKTVIVTKVDSYTSTSNKVDVGTITNSSDDKCTNTSFDYNGEPILTADTSTMTDSYYDIPVESNDDKGNKSVSEGKRENKPVPKTSGTIGTMTDFPSSSTNEKAYTTTGTMTDSQPKYTISYNKKMICALEGKILELALVKLNDKSIYLEISSSSNGIRERNLYYKKNFFSSLWVPKSQAAFEDDFNTSIAEFIQSHSTDETDATTGGDQHDRVDSSGQNNANNKEEAKNGQESGVEPVKHSEIKKYRPYFDLFNFTEEGGVTDLSEDLNHKLRCSTTCDENVKNENEEIEDTDPFKDQEQNGDDENILEAAKRHEEKPYTKIVENVRKVKMLISKNKKKSAKEEDDDDEDGFFISRIGLSFLLVFLLS